MRIKTKTAFSFVEVMVVALLSTVVFAGIYSTFIVGNRAWGHYSDSIAAKKEARRALLWMVKELREAENVRVISEADGCSIHFYRPAVGAVSYTWSREGGNANKIIRRNRLNTRILARYISALSFHNTVKAVIIDIRASKATTTGNDVHVALKEKVALRSKTVFFR